MIRAIVGLVICVGLVGLVAACVALFARWMVNAANENRARALGAGEVGGGQGGGEGGGEERDCPRPGCGGKNRAGAKFCARCGCTLG